MEALLRQLEYQAGLATTRGERGIDVAWLRAELGYADDAAHQTEEARWAVARQVTMELAANAGVTDSDRAWAASVRGLDPDA